MKCQFVVLKILLNREGHIIVQVCLFFSCPITSDVEFSYIYYSTMEFIIMTLDWTDEFPCGTAILYLTY